MAYLDDLRNALLTEAPRRGFDPVDVASIFSYETGGTFDPWQAGPTTQWGQHFGLFQAGEPQRKQYGLYEGMPVQEQVKAFFNYITDKGVKYGDPLDRMYAAVNAGGPDNLLARDSRGNTVLEKLRDEFPAHREKALGLINPSADRRATDIAIPQQQQDPMAELEGFASNDRILGGTSSFNWKPYLSGGAASRPDSISGFQPDFRSRLEAFIASAPGGLGIMSGYRSPKVQKVLFDNAVRKYGSVEAARKWVAPPGRSRHNSGNAADLTFASPEAQQWAHANAAKFGLNFRMGHEPWHIEPLDIESAASGGDFDSELFGGTGSDMIDTGPVKSLIDPNADVEDQFAQLQASASQASRNARTEAQFDPEYVPLQTEEPEGIPEQIWNMVKQTGGNAVDLASALPWYIGAGAVAPGEWLGRQASQLISPETYDPDTFSITDWLYNQGVAGQELSNSWLDIEAPQTFGEQASRNVLTNSLLGGGPIAPLARLAATEAITAIQTFGPNVAAGLQDFVFGPAVASAPDPTLQVTPPDHDAEMWKVLGPLAAITGLMAGFPYAARGTGRLLGWNKLKWEPVPYGPTGSIKTANWQDQMAGMTYDSWAPVTNIMTRVGIPKQILQGIDDVLKINTRASAKALGSGAVSNGHAETLSRQFKVKVPVAQLEKAIADEPMLGQYISVLDLLDRFRLPKAASVIQGFTRRQVQQMKTQIERANPKTKDFAIAYQESVAELWKFVKSGAYGLDGKSTRDIFAGRPNLVPMGKVAQDAFLPNPATALGNFIHKMFVESLHGEARGTIVDAFSHSTYKEIKDGMFIPITAKQYAKNKDLWIGNVVTVPRGKKTQLYYVGDDLIADMMHIDPFEITGQFAQGVHGLKRIFEIGATGVGNPAFAFTSMLRNWGTALMTVPKGYKGPGLINPILAIPQQVLPLAAKAMASNIEAALLRNNSSFWGSMPGTAKGLSAMLSNAWHNSYLGQMERYGPHAGTFMDDQLKVIRQRDDAFRQLNSLAQQGGKAGLMGKTIARTFAALGRGWAELLYATHGAPQFAVARRNMKKRPIAQWPHIIKMSAELTGNPRQGGQPFVVDAVTGKRRMVRGPLAKPVRNVAGAVTEFGQVATPWFPPITQGISAMMKSYWRDPIRFTARLWTYVIAPSMALYMYNRGQGPEYNQYQMEGRSNLDKATNFYIAVPGKEPEEGIRFPVPQELSAMKALAETLVHYSLPSTNKFGHVIEEGDALWDIAENFLLRVILPPPSILETAFLSGRGVNPPSSLVGDDVYVKREQAFDQFGPPVGLGLETFLRSNGGALGQMFVEAMTAFTQSQGGVLGDAMNAGLEEVFKGQLTRLPFGSVFGAVPRMSMDTPIHQELMQKHDALQEMSDFWDAWGDAVEPTISLKPQSKEGEKYVQRAIGDLGLLGQEQGTDSAPYPGMPPPPPNNELYIAVMKEIHDKLMTDTESDGLKGFVSMNRRLGNIIDAQLSMRQVNAGNFVQWAERVKNDPDIQAALGGIKAEDKWDPERAMNWLQSERNQLERRILLVIKAVEADLSKRVGREIKLEDLSPYTGAGNKVPDIGEIMERGVPPR